MLQVYIVTGCDYISYVSGIGKVTFMNYFYQHANFINGSQSNGSLSQTQPSEMQVGFFSIVRLFGTAYFKKNLATVVSKLGYETPEQLFNSMDPSLSVESKHKEWYNTIKRIVRLTSEDQRPLTLTALWRHWMRSCWVKEMWRNSTITDLYGSLAAPELQGWLYNNDSGYSIDWEDKEVQKKVQATLDFLNKGCVCKTGCHTKRCSCVKANRQCGASCECRGCTNIQLRNPPELQEEEEREEEKQEQQEEQEQEQEEDEELEDYSDYESDEERVETEVISDRFDFGFVLFRTLLVSDVRVAP